MGRRGVGTAVFGLDRDSRVVVAILTNLSDARSSRPEIQARSIADIETARYQ